MRRKSERNAGKKIKTSPEKKMEKTKRTRTRHRKQSTSSGNESAEEISPDAERVIETEKSIPKTPVKEGAVVDESQDQVWQVKAAEGGKDTGEIQKLKICLTRPPTTPEMTDRSPRSKRKHSRTTSSSDTLSGETPEDRKKSKHRSKRTIHDSKKERSNSTEHPEEDSDKKNEDVKSNEDVTCIEKEKHSVPDETPVSTTKDECKIEESNTLVDTACIEVSQTIEGMNLKKKLSDADTTVVSPKGNIDQDNLETIKPSDDSEIVNKLELQEDLKTETKEISHSDSLQTQKDSEENRTSTLEETLDLKVSKNDDKIENNVSDGVDSQNSSNKVTVENPVVESSETAEMINSRRISAGTEEKHDDSVNERNEKDLIRSDSVQSTQEEIFSNGQAPPIVVSRKRRWGSRTTKAQSQKSITISTDVLKEIIPDVKPAEFDEVIEEKKHKRIEVFDKIERPVLPKIVIDNTENIELKKKDHVDKDSDISVNESSLGVNRRISILKESDSIITKPPSPPQHKQSSILYITNLVRPFTLPQLKNLLQRTGRIMEDGFWIDKIKSRCFVKYENEDQAVETRHALHGVTWPVSNPKTLQVDFSNQESFDKAKKNEDSENLQTSAIPGTVEDWLREQDLKRERGELVNERPWDRKPVVREWDVGKNGKDKEKIHRDERPLERRRPRTPERSPEPAKKFKKKEEEAPAKLLDDLFRKTKSTPCIYWLPLSAETIAIKEEQRRQHMAEHERRLQELRRTTHRDRRH